MAGKTAAGPPTNVTVVMDEQEEVAGSYKEEVRAMLAQEARAVSVWALLTPLLRLALEPLTSQACEKDGDTCPSSNLTVLAGWLLSAFPQSVARNMAPGFIFASAWLLFAVRDNFGVLPNIPLRICETFMGRLSLRDLCIVMPVHFLCTLSTFTILNLLLPSSLSSIALAPIVYSENTAWFADFIREAAATCAFTVAFLVLPELFILNKVPRFLTAVVMYPLYSFTVDANGMASTFGPNVLYALGARSNGGGLGQSTSRFCGVMLGGVVGGNIMRRYFPDDAKR